MSRQDTDIAKPPKKVAMLTAGGLAPCLSSSVGALITEYAVKHPSVELICYVNGYKGLLLGESIIVTPGIRATAQVWSTTPRVINRNSRLRTRHSTESRRTGPALARRIADWQLARQAHQRQGLHQAWAGQGGTGSATGTRAGTSPLPSVFFPCSLVSRLASHRTPPRSCLLLHRY
jgi:6-phosphofructokinase